MRIRPFGALILVCGLSGATAWAQAPKEKVEKEITETIESVFRREVQKKPRLVFTPEMRRAVEPLDTKTAGDELERKIEEQEDRTLREDVLTCARDAVLVKPLTNAAQAGARAAIVETWRAGSTVDTIVRAAEIGFRAKVQSETDEFAHEPRNRLNDVVSCVIGKRVKEPIRAAVLQCAVKKGLTGKSCADDAITSLFALPPGH